MTETNSFQEDTPTKRQEVIRSTIRDIEDRVEGLFPDDLDNQNYIFTRLYNNIQARLIHEYDYKRKLNPPIRN